MSLRLILHTCRDSRASSSGLYLGADGCLLDVQDSTDTDTGRCKIRRSDTTPQRPHQCPNLEPTHFPPQFRLTPGSLEKTTAHTTAPLRSWHSTKTWDPLRTWSRAVSPCLVSPVDSEETLTSLALFTLPPHRQFHDFTTPASPN